MLGYLVDILAFPVHYDPKNEVTLVPSKFLSVYDFGMKKYTSQPIRAQLFLQGVLKLPALPFIGTADIGVGSCEEFRSLCWPCLEPWTPGLVVVLRAFFIVSSKDMVM